MFDFLRNLTKSAAEKRQEAVAAYLDEALSNRARQQFEQEMAQDETLRLEVEQLLLIKQSLRQLPQREVPRNFMLDPAKYGRPAPQPWVKAYPVLRVATAMTAFFLVFAFATGIFTGLGSGDSEAAMSAPVADVAQVEVTRVVTEETETQAFEADEEEAMAEEAPAEEAAEPAADMAAEEEMADEEVVEESAAPAAPEATAVPSVTDSLQGTAEEDGEQATEPLVAPTPTVLPTPTISTLPRVTPPTPLPERDMDQATGDDVANEVVADLPETEGDTISTETTAVLPEEDVKELRGEDIQPFNPLLALQIGLGVLLLLLAGLTFYARRQR